MAVSYPGYITSIDISLARLWIMSGAFVDSTLPVYHVCQTYIFHPEWINSFWRTRKIVASTEFCSRPHIIHGDIHLHRVNVKWTRLEGLSPPHYCHVYGGRQSGRGGSPGRRGIPLPSLASETRRGRGNSLGREGVGVEGLRALDALLVYQYY